MSLFMIIVGYIIGSCPTGFLAAKYVKGVDIRNFGSGNIGATNAGRLLGRKWAFAVALFDMFKGGLAIMLANCFTDRSVVLALTGAFAVLGHNYPVWLGFRGGKGVATTFGVFAFFDFFNPWPAVLGGCVWYVVMRKTGYVSAASLVALFASVLLMPLFGMPRPYYVTALLLCALSVWRHRANIKRISDGTEPKAG